MEGFGGIAQNPQPWHLHLALPLQCVEWKRASHHDSHVGSVQRYGAHQSHALHLQSSRQVAFRCDFATHSQCCEHDVFLQKASNTLAVGAAAPSLLALEVVVWWW